MGGAASGPEIFGGGERLITAFLSIFLFPPKKKEARKGQIFSRGAMAPPGTLWAPSLLQSFISCRADSQKRNSGQKNCNPPRHWPSSFSGVRPKFLMTAHSKRINLSKNSKNVTPNLSSSSSKNCKIELRVNSSDYAQRNKEKKKLQEMSMP